MRHRIFLFATFLLSLFLTTSCIFMGPSITGNGDVERETRKVGEFDELKVSRGMNVFISQGERFRVVVEADENLMRVIKTDIEGDALVVSTSHSIRKARSKKVFVTVPDISVVKSSSGSNIKSKTVLEGQDIEISSSSGSNIILQLDARKVKASASSGSNITLKGEADHFTGKASSGSNIKAGDLKTDNSSVKVSSGANLWISVDNKLEAGASSGANVYYYGKPSSTNIEKSSGGNVKEK